MMTLSGLLQGRTSRRLVAAAACVMALGMGRSPWMASAEAQTSFADEKNIFEIRVYNITPGKMDDFVKWMEVVTKWQESVGMEILGQFAAPAQNKYVWVRQYPDEATRKRRFAAVYDSGGMKTFGPPPGYEGGDVYLTHAAKQSKLQFPGTAAALMPKSRIGAGPVIYEFRIYDVKPGTKQGFGDFMGDKMVPWQLRAWKVDVLAQLLPYAKVTGAAGGGKLDTEDRTYIWSRVFDNEHVQQEKYQMYKDPEFRSVGSPAEAGLDKVRIVILTNPTTFSKLQ